MIVIGIGGSNLGAIAVHEAINGLFYNESTDGMKVYWADGVDTLYINYIVVCMEQALKNKQYIILNVISKSGTTTETIALYELLVDRLKIYHPDDYHRYVVITTDNGSALWHLAQKKSYTLLEIPPNVGGRFSIFTPVGLFPLAMLGININQLLQGARSMMPEFIDSTIFNNASLLSACVLGEQYRQGVRVHDTFIFSKQLEAYGKWYRQLLGESIGKEYTRDAQQLHVGILPTVSIGSIDLHSVGQLYLSTPRMSVTTFVTVQSLSVSLEVPISQEEPLIGGIEGKSLDIIQQAIIVGTQEAYQSQKKPFMVISIPDLSAFSMGQLLLCKMLEIMYLGYILEVNPFDQPNVELYKKHTRKILNDK